MDSTRGRKAADAGVMPFWVPGVNRAVFNRIQVLWAPYIPPYAVIVHRGRRTNRQYRTPVTAFRSGSTIAVMLPYGTKSDWVLNLLAAGRGGVERGGRLHRISNPRIVDDPAELPPLVRPLGRYMKALVADYDA